jgi:transposase InsO family protein
VTTQWACPGARCLKFDFHIHTHTGLPPRIRMLGNDFRSLKSEWIPSTGYLTAQEAQRDISHYLMHRYNWTRPHQLNGGLRSRLR